MNSDICTLSVPSQRKAEKPKFRIEYTLTARLFSVFTLSFNFFSRYAVLVPSNLSAARIALSLYGTSGSSYTLETREVLRLLHREFVYVGDPVPELNEQEHAAFLMNIQKSILLSLEKRKLLTHSQRERCLVELEKQYSREQKSRRRA